jgi:integrase
MARHVRDTSLESRTARAKLKPSGKPYYRAIGEGLHLGYRKGQTEGKWVVRRYVGNQGYKVETIALADDTLDADGVHVLTMFQAQDKARGIAAEGTYSGPYRVKDAVEYYLEYLDGRGWGTKERLGKHVLPKLGDMKVDDLSPDILRAWHRGIAADDRRQSKASANRLLTMFKACLNRAYKDGKIGSDKAWRGVHHFRGVEASRTRYLSLDEVTRFLNASDAEFRLLARGALETGARYGELRRLLAGDYNPDAGTVHVRKSKTGKERHIMLSPDGRAYFDQLTAGKPKDAPMFGKAWRVYEHTAYMKKAITAARIEPTISFHGLRHTWASLSVMGGMPLMVVSHNLGHANTRMVEKHYGHLAPSYVAQQIEQFAPRFGTVEGNVAILSTRVR